MTVIQSLLAFTAAAGVLTLTPGVDTVMVLRTATLGGRRPAAFAAAGIGLGCLIWGAGVALGLGALLAASQVAFTIVKWAGAAYLLWLGLGLLFKPGGKSALAESATAATAGLSPWRAMRRGLLTNLLNPKVGVFYITFLPQFVPGGANVAAYSFLLACVHVALGAVWSAALIIATAPLSQWLTRPKVARAMNRVTGGVFVAFGVRLALARRG